MNTTKTSQKSLVLALGILALSTTALSIKTASQKLHGEQFSNNTSDTPVLLAGYRGKNSRREGGR